MGILEFGGLVPALRSFAIYNQYWVLRQQYRVRHHFCMWEMSTYIRAEAVGGMMHKTS